MARWAWRDKSIAFALETTFGTAATTGFEALPAEVELPEFVRDIEDFQFSTPQVGSFDPPVTGSKHGGTLKIRVPVRSLAPAYDPDPGTDVPGVTADIVSREMALFANALGSDASSVTATADIMAGKNLSTGAPFSNSGVIAGGASSFTVADADKLLYPASEMIVTDVAKATGTAKVGWIKTVATGATATITLFEAPQTAPVTGDDIFPTAAAYLSGEEPHPLTFRVVGDNAAECITFAGCVCSEWELSLVAGKTPILSLTYIYTDKKWDSTKLLGGLLTPDSFRRLAPALGTNGGWATLDGTETNGLHEFMIKGSNTLAAIRSHSATQGVSEMVQTRPDLEATVAIPYATGDAVDSDGEHIYETKFLAGTTVSLGVYYGKLVGRVASALLPAWHISAQPTMIEVDGLNYLQLTLRPDTYAGDTVGDGAILANCPALNSNFRFGVG